MRLLFLLLALTFSLSSFAQDTNYVDPNYTAQKQKKLKKKKSFGESLYFGGTFGLQFGSITSVLVEPMVGYRITEKWSTGLGIGVRYGKDNRYTQSVEYTNYLGRLFTRYLITSKFYAHVEYMAESYDEVFLFEGQSIDHKGRTLVPFLFVGGGFRSQAGRGSFIFQVLFNVLNDRYSTQAYPSGTPYISIGYIGGF